MSFRAEIMALPEADRLPAALDMIGDLMGGGSADRAHWARALNASPGVAAVFLALWSRPGVTVTHDALSASLEWNGYKADADNTKVYVCYLRRALRALGFDDGGVKLHWGVGYYITPALASQLAHLAPVAAPEYRPRGFLGDRPADDPLARQGEAWSDQDDQDLRRMLLRGDDPVVIADELQRTQRAISERCRTLGLPVFFDARRRGVPMPKMKGAIYA